MTAVSHDAALHCIAQRVHGLRERRTAEFLRTSFYFAMRAFRGVRGCSDTKYTTFFENTEYRPARKRTLGRRSRAYHERLPSLLCASLPLYNLEEHKPRSQ